MRIRIAAAAVVLSVLAIGMARAGYVGTYVDATLDNTDNAAGGDDSTWATTADSPVDGLWRYPATSAHGSWAVFGNGGCMEGYGLTDPGIPMAATTITGLTPGASYEIRLCFGNQTVADLSILGGLSTSSMTVYNASNSDLAVAGTYYYEDGYMNVRQALLGVAQADASGSITAYVGADPSGLKEGRACYDGLTYNAVPEPTSLALMMTGVIGLLAYAWRKRK